MKKKTVITGSEMFCINCGKMVSVTVNHENKTIECQCGAYVPDGKQDGSRLADGKTNLVRANIGMMASEYNKHGYNFFRWMYNVCGTSKIYYADLNQLILLSERERAMRMYVREHKTMMFLDKIEFGMYESVEQMHSDFIREYTEALYDYCVQNSDDTKSFYVEFKKCLEISKLFRR